MCKIGLGFGGSISKIGLGLSLSTMLGLGLADSGLVCCLRSGIIWLGLGLSGLVSCLRSGIICLSDLGGSKSGKSSFLKKSSSKAAWKLSDIVDVSSVTKY